MYVYVRLLIYMYIIKVHSKFRTSLVGIPVHVYNTCCVERVQLWPVHEKATFGFSYNNSSRKARESSKRSGLVRNTKLTTKIRTLSIIRPSEIIH